MVIKYVSVCEYTAPKGADKPKYLQRGVCLGRCRSSTGFLFEPLLLGEKKVLKVYKLPRVMQKKEVTEWFKTKKARFLFDIVDEIIPINPNTPTEKKEVTSRNSPPNPKRGDPRKCGDPEKVKGKKEGIEK